MITTNRAQLAHLKQLLFIEKHEDLLAGELADAIRLLGSAPEELGNRMDAELRRSCRDTASEAATKCRDDTSSLVRDAQTI